MTEQGKMTENECKQCTPAEKSTKTCDLYEQAAPPDGGWGWVIVFASFMIHVVTDGVVYSFGELFKEFLNEYKEGAGVTSLIPSILVGTTLCSGPIASSFVNKFGCRPVTIVGSVISAFCIVISVYASSVGMLIVTLGLGTGIGFGLIYLPAIVSVTCYFEKYRSVATGIGVCGSGFGTVVFAPLIKISIIYFGLKGTLVMIAGMVLTCIFYGLLLRPVPLIEKESEEKKSIIYKPETVPLTTVTLVDDEYQNEDTCCGRRYSIHGMSDLILEKNKLSTKSVFQFVSQPTLVNNSCLNQSNPSLKSNNCGSGIMHRKDIFFTGSTRSIKELSKSNTYLSAVQKQTITHKNIPEKKKYSCIPCSLECQATFAEMTDFSLLKDTIFLMFAVSNFLTSIGFNLPYLYIPNQVDGKYPKSEWSSYLLSAIGAGNTAGRIILGYVADKPKVNRLVVYNICLTLCGIACIINVFCVSIVQNIIYALFYGFTTGAYVGLTSVITVDLFGLDKLTNAFGMLLLFQGIASFIGPPLAGFVCDRFDPLQTFDPPFYISGITIFLSGVMLFFVPPLQRYLQKKRRDEVSEAEKC